ncbi:MAG: hypothetical protein ACP5UN_03720, partial [Candidatus Micrarchaeia archaeon]
QNSPMLDLFKNSHIRDSPSIVSGLDYTARVYKYLEPHKKQEIVGRIKDATNFLLECNCNKDQINEYYQQIAAADLDVVMELTSEAVIKNDDLINFLGHFKNSELIFPEIAKYSKGREDSPLLITEDDVKKLIDKVKREHIEVTEITPK